jgi:crotonobetainyl-CoA:carnitine CoA-transferase CaiB-like acyl-CoA transferase
MLQRMQHPQLGDVVLPNTPIRLHGAVEPSLEPSPALGQHNEEIYSDWLGLSTDEIDRLRSEGVL